MLKRITMALVGAVAFSAAANAGPVSDVLYYTTFGGGGNIWKVTGTYTGNGTVGNGTFTLSGDTNLASAPGADGLVFNPNNGDLLVGGQGSAIYQVNPGTGTFTGASVPGMAVFELAVDPSGNVVWGGGAESGSGGISSTPINPFGAAGTTHPVTGAVTTITHITFAPGLPAGTAFFTSNPDNSGAAAVFGTITLSTGATTSIFTSTSIGFSFHGMEYDPFSGDLILAGGNQLLQIDPTSHSIVSSLTLASGQDFDQGAVDGLGHIFWADNNGKLLFLDYSTTDHIGDPNNFVSDNFFKNQLDDIAPLTGEGGRVPEPMTLTLFGAGLAGVAAMRRRKKAKV